MGPGTLVTLTLTLLLQQKMTVEGSNIPHLTRLLNSQDYCGTTKTNEKFATYGNMKAVLFFCYDGKFDVLMSIPITALQPASWQGYVGSWKGFVWYMENAWMSDAGSSYWGNTFANTGGWADNSYGYAGEARKWKKILTNFTKTGQSFSFRLNMTGQPDSELPATKKPNNCTVILICAWATGWDPCWRLGFCKVPPPKPTETKGQSNTTGNIKASPRTPEARKVTIIKGELKSDDWFKIMTGISKNGNNWLMMVEQAANNSKSDCIVCMGPRPLLKVVPALLISTCLLDVMTTDVPRNACSRWDNIYPLTPETKGKPIFSSKVARANFTCLNLTGGNKNLGKLNSSWCSKIVLSDSTKFRPKSRADVWWWCGATQIYDRMPINATGVCALVSLLLPVQVSPMSFKQLAQFSAGTFLHSRRRREVTWKGQEDPTYIDAIGVPRGVPDEYKLVDQVGAGFESALCWWCTINKNVDRINYIHYNVQRLGNWTQLGFEAVHGQLAAASLMTFQNRIALDMLLAEKGGVCSMFGEQCCTFIPNNTASDGSLTLAIDGLKTLNKKMKEHSGVDTSMWDNWLNVFGRYKSLVASILVSVAVFAAILTACGCCFIPCLRSLITRMIVTAVGPQPPEPDHLYPLLQDNTDNDDSENEYHDLPDLFPDPGNDNDDGEPDTSV